MLTQPANPSHSGAIEYGSDASLDACLMRNWGRLCTILNFRADAALVKRFGTEDLAQEVALHLLSRREEFVYQGELAFIRWMSTAARRLALRWSQERPLETHAVRLTRTPESGGESLSPSWIPGTQATPGTQLAFRQELKRLNDALSEMPLREREALILVRLEGFSIAEAAALMDCTYQAAAARLRRGIERLFRALRRVR